MARLPDTWLAHLAAGVSLRVGASTPEGQPELHFGHGMWALPDGRLELLVRSLQGADLLAAIRATGRVAVSAGRPSTTQVLHVKGADAEVLPAYAEQAGKLADCFEAWLRQIEAFGADRRQIHAVLGDLKLDKLSCVRFTPLAAWDQTLAPAPVNPLTYCHDATLPYRLHRPLKGAPPVARQSRFHGGPLDRVARCVVRRRKPAEMIDMNQDVQPERRALKLRDVRRLLEGIIPPAMCSVAADGMPHVNYLSHAEYVDDEHVALTYQFLNRARANVLATGRVALSVEDPITGVSVLLQLRYLRTETEGPIFERLRVKLAGIAAQTGMEKVFHLRGADVYRVESLRKLDPVHPLPAMAPRCDLAAGVRALSEQLGEASDLRALLSAFTEGLQRELRISHAIVWLLDEQRQGLFTLAAIGYELAGSGAELPLSEAGLAGIALRENVPIRIGHMSQMLSYGMSWRVKAEQLGLQAAMADTIPLPGLARPRSQLAVPLRARGRSVGALLVESEHDQFFSYDDEDALAAVGAQLAQGIAALRAAELIDELPAPSAPAGNTPAGSSPLRIRHYARDHSVFVNDEYLIKGVAGAIVAKLVRDQIASGRDAFSTRELRLAGGDLRLPEVQDNLGVRLLLLERRLAERDFGLHIERCGRGQYRLIAKGPLEIVAAG